MTRNIRRPLLGLALLIAAGGLAGCLGATPASSPTSSGSTAGASSGGKTRLTFWHTRRRNQEKLLQEICADYNQASPNVEVVPEFQGSYDDLNKKVRLSVQSKSLPALTVAYEDQVAEYATNNALRPLDDLVSDPEIGLKAEELADLPEQYLRTNRYAQFKDQLLSFPFTKSNLVLYYNRSLLQKAGFSAPPQTWPEFEKQAAAVSRQIGKPAFAFDMDPSTLDGMIFSQGGEVISADGAHTTFDQSATVRMLDLLSRMKKAKTLAQAEPDDLPALFAGQSCAFVLGSSASRANLEELVGTKFDWDIAVIPHAEGVEPVTVMYGPNVCIFKASPEQEREAWKFIKHFISPEVTARWAQGTGYLPIRKSAVTRPEMAAFYEKNPRAKHVYDILPTTKGEPNVVGWREVRSHLQAAAQSVIGAGTAPQAAAVQLKKKADQALAQSR